MGLKASDTKDKYIIWDLDGVLAPYSSDFWGKPISGRLPSKFIQQIVHSCCAARQVAICECTDIKKEEIDLWLKENYPLIEGCIIKSPNATKAGVVDRWLTLNKLDWRSVVCISDSVKSCEHYANSDLVCYHASSLFDFFS